MTDQLKQIIKEEVEKLPEEAKNAINSFDWVKILEEIGRKFALDEIAINNLQIETLLALVGITDLEFYAVNVENQVGVIKDQAQSIADEVVRKVFNPINNTLIETIKKSPKSGNSDWGKNIAFVLSNGNYSVFIEEDKEKTGKKVPQTSVPNNSRKIEEIKSKFTI